MQISKKQRRSLKSSRCARLQGSESGAPSFFYLFLLKSGLFVKTSFVIQVFFRTFAREINRLEYQIAWNIKLARISDRLEYEYVFKIRYKI